jgi:hypothetical protein
MGSNVANIAVEAISGAIGSYFAAPRDGEVKQKTGLLSRFPASFGARELTTPFGEKLKPALNLRQALCLLGGCACLSPHSSV